MAALTLAACGWLRDRDGEAPTEPAPPRSPGDWHSTAYPCVDAGGAEVRMLTINIGGHLFPGGNARTLGGALGGSAPRDWDVEILWDYLSRFAIA